MPGCVNVKLNDAPGANGPELKAPPVAVHVWVTLSSFVTVTVDPSGTDTLEGLKAKLEMVIATWAGGAVVVVDVGGGGGWVVAGGGGGGGWVVGGDEWVATPGAAPLVGGSVIGGAVVAGVFDGAAAPPFAAPPGLSVVVVRDPFPAGLIVDDVPLEGSERLDCDVVVDRFALLNTAVVLPQAAVSSTTARRASTREGQVDRGVCIVLRLPFDAQDALTVILRDVLVAPAGCSASLNLTWNDDVPFEVGVPEIRRECERVRPAATNPSATGFLRDMARPPSLWPGNTRLLTDSVPS